MHIIIFKMRSKFAATLAIAYAEASSIKVGLVSDLHMNLAYDGLAGIDDNCVSGSSAQES